MLGISQALSMYDYGFPYVAVGHLVVTDDAMDNLSRDMLIAAVGKGEAITSFKPMMVDPFEYDTAQRSFGRLWKGCDDVGLGFFAMNYDGVRVFEPLGRPCKTNANYSKSLLDRIGVYYEENHRMFVELPRYSARVVRLWEDHCAKNPGSVTPWDLFKSVFEAKCVTASDCVVVKIDGIERVAHLYCSDDKAYLLYGFGYPGEEWSGVGKV